MEQLKKQKEQKEQKELKIHQDYLKWGIVAFNNPYPIYWDIEHLDKSIKELPKHGIYLNNTINLDDINFPYNKLIDICKPVVEEFYNVDISKLQITHNTLVSFSVDGDRQIRIHKDGNSIITINYCIYSDAEGADITFIGAKKLPLGLGQGIGKGLHTISMKTGWIYIHYGQHAHRTEYLKAGKRYSAILWFS